MASTQAQAASAIRKELKGEFPNLKFRVTSDGGSMHSAVNISLTEPRATDRRQNRTLYDQVRSIVNKYEYGSFDGMIDMYEYNNRRDDIPQVEYVLVHI